MRNWSFRGIDERCPVPIDKQVEVPRDASANTIKRRGKNKPSHYWSLNTMIFLIFFPRRMNEKKKMKNWFSSFLSIYGINSSFSGRISRGNWEKGGEGRGVTQCSAFTLRNLLDDRT